MKHYGPFFAFSSFKEYRKILERKLQLFNKYNQQFYERYQIEHEFLYYCQIQTWIEQEIYPQFIEFFGTNNPNLFETLSRYVKDEITENSDEISKTNFVQIKKLFTFLTSFVKYPSFIRNPENLPSFGKEISPLSFNLYENIFDNKLYHDFLPMCSAQVFIELAHTWNKCSIIFNKLLMDESKLVSKKGETEVFFSSLEPEICCFHPISGPKFNNFITENNECLEQNQLILEKIIPQFHQMSELFNCFKNDVQVFNRLFDMYKTILIQKYPFELFKKILNNEKFVFFSRPEIKINQNIFSSPAIYNDIVSNIGFQISSLEKILDDKIQYENYIKQKYKSIKEEGDDDINKDIYTDLNRLSNIFNKVVEDIDVFDECNKSIQTLSAFLSNKEGYNNMLSRDMGLAHVNNQIECFRSVIKTRKNKINDVKKEIGKNIDFLASIQASFDFLNGIKDNIVQCELCRTERNYVLTNCGHSFCHSCFQYMCLLSPEEMFCPFCNTPFAFESIVKISWSSKKVDDDDDDTED